MLIPCLERYRCLGSCKLEFHPPVLCKESRTSHPPACKARNRPLPQRASLMWSKHAVSSSGCSKKTHWRNATMGTTTIKTDNFLKCKEVEITVPRHKWFGPWDQNMPNFYGGIVIASGSNRKSYVGSRQALGDIKWKPVGPRVSVQVHIVATTMFNPFPLFINNPRMQAKILDRWICLFYFFRVHINGNHLGKPTFI